MKKSFFFIYVLAVLSPAFVLTNCSKNSTDTEETYDDMHSVKLFKSFLAWANSTHPPLAIRYEGTWYYKENILEDRTEWTFQNYYWKILIIEPENPEKNRNYRILGCGSDQLILSAIQNQAGVFTAEFFEFPSY